MSGERIEWIDTMRGIGILIVVYGHNQLEPLPSKYLQLMMVPLFFFASGMVFSPGKYQNYWAFFKRRFRGLVVPYLVFSVVGWLFWIALWAWNVFVQGQPRPAMLVGALAPVIGIPTGIAKFMPYNLALWFLTCLFVTDSLFYLLQRRVKTDLGLLLWMAFFAVVGFAVGKRLFLPLLWNFDTALAVMIYYGAGYLLRKNWGVRFEFKWWIMIILAAAFLAVSVYLTTLNPQTHLKENELGKFHLFHLISITGLVFFIFLAQLLARVRAIGWLGRNTLPLLGMHFVTMTVFHMLIRGVFGLDFWQHRATTPWALFWGTGTLLLIIPCIFLFNRYLPWAVGRTKPKMKSEKFEMKNETA